MIRSTALAAALALASIPLHATTYTLEPGHSQGVVSWSHLGFANPTAQFTMVEGTLDFDPADPTHASVAVTIPLMHLSSGVADLDENLRSAQFFDSAKYPTATFRSSKVEPGNAPDKLKVTGNLTVHGISKSVVLDVTINKVGTNVRNQLPSVGFDAVTMLKRSDFGLGAFVPQVSDEVSVHITCQGDEAKGYARQLKAEAEEDAAQARAAAQKAAHGK
jgi:polyisoprenoid-binding protein YceI